MNLQPAQARPQEVNLMEFRGQDRIFCSWYPAEKLFQTAKLSGQSNPITKVNLGAEIWGVQIDPDPRTLVRFALYSLCFFFSFVDRLNPSYCHKQEEIALFFLLSFLSFQKYLSAKES